MELVVDLAILTVVCCIAVLLLRTKLRVCPRCSSLFVDRPLSDDRPPRAVRPARREPGPFVEVSAVQPQVRPQAKPEAVPQEITESTDEFPVIETREPLTMPKLPANLITPPMEILESGEILIEPATDDDVDLLPATHESQADEDSGEELMLEEDIGLGPRGLPLASRLIDAGFGVTMTPQKWGRGGRRRQTPNDAEDC